MRVIDERGLVWDESPYLAHHGIMGMHWGIRRYQPYSGDYRGDGRYVGKRKEIKNAFKDAKKEYKERKISAKEPYLRAKERNSEAFNRYSQADNDKDTVEALTEEAYIDLEEQRDQLKEAKAYYKDRKKFGSIEQEREAKQGIKDAEKRIERARLNVEKALMDERAVKKTLKEASRDFDESYTEMQVQKALYKESKKLAKQRLNEIKQQLKEEKKYIEVEKKQHALDYDKKFAGDDTSTKLPQKDKNSRAAEQKDLLNKANAADKARKDFIDSKIKKYNPKTSEERDIAVAKVEKDNTQKLKKLADSSTEAWKRYDASRLKQRDFNKARSLRKRGFTYIEIAERLGVPPTTVWGILNY